MPKQGGTAANYTPCGDRTRDLKAVSAAGKRHQGESADLATTQTRWPSFSLRSGEVVGGSRLSLL